MGKEKNSKAKEKKRQRLELEKLMKERLALVDRANAQENPLSVLPSFTTYKKNGVDVSLTTERVSSLDEKTKDWLVDLITRNMKRLYEESDWGWKLLNKREEMMEDSAWYMIARLGTEPVAFSHFRFDMDYEDEVLYVYEIQLEETYRRKGLGTFMLKALELLAIKNEMRKIMATIFKHNPSARKFFKDILKYQTDETSPIDDIHEQFDYEIVSRFNKKKIAAESALSSNISSSLS